MKTAAALLALAVVVPAITSCGESPEAKAAREKQEAAAQQELFKNVAEQAALAEERECTERMEKYNNDANRELCEERLLPLAKGLRAYPEMAYKRKEFKDQIKAICKENYNCGDDPQTTLLQGEIIAIEAAVMGRDPNKARETYLTSAAKSKAYIEAERQKEYWDTHNKNTMRIMGAGAAATAREEDRRAKEEAKRFSTTYEEKK